MRSSTRPSRVSIRNWQENPAWLNRALAKNFDALQEGDTPAAWLPMIHKPKTSRSGEMLVDFHELGCGAYGCVLDTHDKNVVMKVTSDMSEVDFVELAQPWGWPAGITSYFGIERLEGEYTITRKYPGPHPLAILWRESARHVGKIGAPKLDIDTKTVGFEKREIGAEFMEAIYDTSAPVYAMLDKAKDPKALEKEAHAVYEPVALDAADLAKSKKDVKAFAKAVCKYAKTDQKPYAMARYIAAYRIVATEMAKEPTVGEIGKALLFYLNKKVMLADLHLGNIGVVNRSHGGATRPVWAITDPGNVVVFDKAW